MTESSQEPEDIAEPQEEQNAGDSGDADDAREESEPAAEAPPGDDENLPRLLPAGNPPRWVRGSLLLVGGALLALAVMAIHKPLRAGVPVGGLGVLLATLGCLDLAGTFDDADTRVAYRASLRQLVRPLALLAASSLGLFASISMAVAGRVPIWGSAITVTAFFIAMIVGAFNTGEVLGVYRLDEAGKERPLVRRHGFWLLVLVSLLYLPMLGSHALSDPWETHYGEVSREILARNDWISLWWAQDGWFWSKPVLDFWIQALCMSLFGVRHAPGQMLSVAAEGRMPWPEWAVRMPIFMLSLLAIYLLYKAVSKLFGRRAGFLGGLVLATVPQWFLVSHQTMTDMPFVATMAGAMALFMLGVHSDPDEEARVYELRIGASLSLRLSAFHLLSVAVVACALPQILYLLSRHIEIGLSPFDIRLHGDVFTAGSAGNCGLPGNEACRRATPVVGGLYPWLQAALWAQALGMLLYLNWGERRISRLYFMGAWFLAALSTMAKGPAGIGLPVLCAIAYLIVSKRGRDLLRMEILSGALILLVVAMPWFVAMYARHGQPFTDRLLFHDMFKRAFTHVHDTNEGDDVSFRFYVWQLGYALFPWTGLVPVGLSAWLSRREDKKDGDFIASRKTDGCVMLGTWFLFAFALFSLMLTKFHHYILPAIPPAAMLVGIALDEMLGAGKSGRQKAILWSAMGVCGALGVWMVGRDIAFAPDGLPGQIRLLHLFTYNYRRPWPTSLDFTLALRVFVSGAAMFTFLMTFARIRKIAVGAMFALAGAFTLWGLDVYFVRTSPHWGQRELLLAYVTASKEIPGPFIAYQMNWKGENFYSGNRMAAFVSSGKKFQDYILDEKKKGAKTFYFVTEHGRAGSLANELGSPRIFQKLTTPELNNKFVLLRATFD